MTLLFGKKMLAARLLFLALSFLAVLGSPLAHSSRLTEADIRLEVYRAVYAGQGPYNELPKAFVFATDGRCVGVFTATATNAAVLWDAVDAALGAGVEACAIRHSDEFPGAGNSGPAKPIRERVILVTMREDFCRACAEYRVVLKQGLEARPAVDLSIYTVMLPGDPLSKEPCPTCSKD